MKKLASLLVCALVFSSPSEAHQHRSAAAKAEFQRQQACPASGKHRGKCPGWIIDHIDPLCHGGADAPSNMQWQTVEEAKKKDRLEKKLCTGKISMDQYRDLNK